MKEKSSLPKYFVMGAAFAAAALFAGCSESGSSAAQGSSSASAAQPAQAQPASAQGSDTLGYDESLVRVEKIYTDGASLGQPYEFQIVVTAVRPASSVKIRQALPDSVAFSSSFPAAELDDSGAPVWDLGAMEQGDTRNLNLVVVPSALGNFSFRTTVKAQPVAQEVVKVGQPEINAELTGPTSVELGQNTMWKLLVTNNGSSPARNLNISATLPSGFTLAGPARQRLARLLPGQSTLFDVEATPSEAGVYNAHFSVGYDGGETIQKNSRIEVLGSQVRLAIAGTASRHIFSPATYEITVTNTGGTALENLVLTNDLPEGVVLYGEVADGGEVFSLASGEPVKLALRNNAESGFSGYWVDDSNPLRDDSADQVKWTLETLAPGQSRTWELNFYSIKPGSPQSDAKVVSSRGLSATASYQSEWKAIPGIYTSLVDSADPIQLGDSVTYTISARNQSAAGTIVVRSQQVEIPAVLRIKSASEGGVIRGNTVYFPSAELGPQKELTHTVEAEGVKLGTGIATMKTETNFHAEAIVNEQSISVY